MVTLHTPQMQSSARDASPVMPRHELRAKKDTLTFKEGETGICFISKMSDGRFAVMDGHFKASQKHYEVHTEESLHESFDEL